jgi:ATP-binding cassette subfamily B protein
MQDLRNSLYTHLQHMPLRFFTSTRTGEIQSRLANDVGGVQTVVTDTASSILSNVVVIISTLVAMLFLSVPLTLLSLCLMPFFLWLTVKVGRARREVATTTQKTMADMTAVTEETLSVSGILLSKTFGRQDYEIGRFQQENERLTGLQVRQTMIGRSFFAVVGTFFSITPALVYLVAAIVNKNAADPSNLPINAGIIVGFTTLQSRLFFPIGSMLQVSTDVQSSFALFDRIFEYLDLRHDIVDAPDAEALVNVQGAVELDHVRFHYDRSDDVPEDDAAAMAARTWTLDDVTLRIQPGQLAALVGPSGAGKTTVTNLLLRFLDPVAGRVAIAGRDARHYRQEDVRRVFGLAGQDAHLFDSTIRENLRLARPDASDPELGAVLDRVRLGAWVASLPDGLDTLVGEEGTEVSGGQRQRLVVARALLAGAPVLVLDEPTAHLDGATASALMEDVLAAAEGKSVLLVTHRPEGLERMDEVVTLEGGRVVETVLQ